MTVQASLSGRVTSQAPVLDAEQQNLAGLVREVVQRHRGSAPGPDDAPGVHDGQLWQRLATQIGIAGLAIPEEYGGAGGSYLDCHLVLAELGRAVTPSPFLATMLAAQELLAAQQASGPKTALSTLEAIASGDLTATVLTSGVTAAGPDAEGFWHLSGHDHLVLDGAAAQVLLVRVPARDGYDLFELTELSAQPAGAVQAITQPTMDRALHLAAVTLTQAQARHAGTLSAAQAARLDDLRPIAASAIQIGGARHCLETTVEYLRTRTQFGRPLGSFQALKHRVADLLVLAETGESASWGAAAAWADDADDLGLLAAVAGTYCGEAYREVTAQTVQLHGGIAITWEHEAHRHLKQAHTMATLFGTPAGHRARLISDLGLA
jgi:hypothetical protein